MKKIYIFIAIIFATFIQAKTIEATYKVSFGIFGSIGKAKAVLNIDKDNNYHISISAKATGLAKLLSNGRVEKYESEGKVVNGFLKPDIYQVTIKTHSKTIKKYYYFLHEQKRVDKLTIREKNGKESKSEESLKYFADNDILTLFFNVKKYLNSFNFYGKKVLYAVGANKKDGGVDLIAPIGKKLKSLKDDLGEKGGHFLIVYINQKIFSSKKGELLINVNDDGIATKALLKDVILFGDIRGVLENIEKY